MSYISVIGLVSTLLKFYLSKIDITQRNTHTLVKYMEYMCKLKYKNNFSSWNPAPPIAFTRKGPGLEWVFLRLGRVCVLDFMQDDFTAQVMVILRVHLLKLGRVKQRKGLGPKEQEERT